MDAETEPESDDEPQPKRRRIGPLCDLIIEMSSLFKVELNACPMAEKISSLRLLHNVWYLKKRSLGLDFSKLVEFEFSNEEIVKIRPNHNAVARILQALFNGLRNNGQNGGRIGSG